MHIQLVTFALEGISDADLYAAMRVQAHRPQRYPGTVAGPATTPRS